MYSRAKPMPSLVRPMQSNWPTTVFGTCRYDSESNGGAEIAAAEWDCRWTCPNSNWRVALMVAPIPRPLDHTWMASVSISDINLRMPHSASYTVSDSVLRANVHSRTTYNDRDSSYERPAAHQCSSNANYSHWIPANRYHTVASSADPNWEIDHATVPLDCWKCKFNLNISSRHKRIEITPFSRNSSSKPLWLPTAAVRLGWNSMGMVELMQAAPRTHMAILLPQCSMPTAINWMKWIWNGRPHTFHSRYLHSWIGRLC